MVYEAKGMLALYDVGLAEVWDPVVTDLLNSEAVFYGQTPQIPAQSLSWNKAVRYGRNAQVGPILSTDNILGDSTTKIELNHKLKQYRAAVTIEDARVLEAQKNGIGMLKDAWASEFELTVKDLAYDVNTALFADEQSEGFGTVTANEMDGLRGLLKTAGTIYGQARSSYALLAANVDTSTTTFSFSAFRAWLTELKTAGGKNFVVYTTYSILDIVRNAMENNKLYMGVSAQAGFEGAITIDGIPLIADKDCPDDHIFILDRDAYYMQVFTPFTLGSTKPIAKVNLTETMYIVGRMDLVFERFNTSYKITGITA